MNNNAATLETTTTDLVVESSNDDVNPNVLNAITLPMSGSGASGDDTLEISSGSPQDDDDDDNNDASQKDQEPPKPRDSRWVKMYTTSDWWSLWIV
jgi:hypothetical protein